MKPLHKSIIFWKIYFLWYVYNILEDGLYDKTITFKV